MNPRENEVNRNLIRIFCGLFVATMVVADAGADTVARSAVNIDRARAVGTPASTQPRAKQPVIMQRGGGATRTNTVRNVSVRTATTPNRVLNSGLSRAARIISDAGDAIIRRALGLTRSAVPQTSVARTAVPTVARSAAVPAGASRARATAVFSDMSKLGDGYNNCRTAYNTCMDQFCAGANETFRRCFCSNTFRTLRDKEEALDAATTMLAQFEDNNLNAVGLSADEVSAMYSATAGEQAIKKDTSASAALLNDIGDLLSGRKKASDTNAMTSLTGMSIDFNSDLGDIWSSNSSESLFGSNGGVDLSTLEGIELYNQANNQCLQLVASSCEAGAVRNMAKSAYNILITQDCNAYQKKLDQKTEQVKTTVRTAEKYLREARLEEYRSHNSADVNECMDKVETAITAQTACGPNYVKCLDYSGVYINSSTGEPIYSARLFGLNEIIQLDGSSDVLSRNAEFNQFLDSKRVYAKSALDTCRDMADIVWTEFKRNALIKISQAQDEKIEEVKMSCVNTMKECYDTQSGALKSFDDTTAQASGALAARTSRDMCSDKVLACAALYGDPTKCEIDIKTNRVKDKGGCGLTSLLNFVSTVDDVRIAEGCGTAVENYLKQLCTPTSGDEGYPWNCRSVDFSKINFENIVWGKNNGISTQSQRTSVAKNAGKDFVSTVVNYAIDTCGVGDNGEIETRAQESIKKELSDIYSQVFVQMYQKCTEFNGIWISPNEENFDASPALTGFYSNVFGGDRTKGMSLGKCSENTTRTRCLQYNDTFAGESNSESGTSPVSRYDADRDECIFSDVWYKQQCSMMGGYFENGVCYVSSED